MQTHREAYTLMYGTLLKISEQFVNMEGVTGGNCVTLAQQVIYDIKLDPTQGLGQLGSDAEDRLKGLFGRIDYAVHAAGPNSLSFGRQEEGRQTYGSFYHQMYAALVKIAAQFIDDSGMTSQGSVRLAERIVLKMQVAKFDPFNIALQEAEALTAMGKLVAEVEAALQGVPEKFRPRTGRSE